MRLGQGVQVIIVHSFMPNVLHGFVEYLILIGLLRHSTVCYFCIADRCYEEQALAMEAVTTVELNRVFLSKIRSFFNQ